MKSARFYLQILIKLVFTRQTFEKYSNTKIMKILPAGAEFFLADAQQTDRQTDRQT
jgi:hypothetical protein